MTAIGKLFRTTAFKLTLAYLLIFTIFAAFVLGYVAWNARTLLFEQVAGTVEVEINGLAEQYNAGGIRRLVAVVERRSRQPGSSLYLVTTAAGETLAGNVSELSPDAIERPGQRVVTYLPSEDADASPHRALVRVFVLPGGFRLLVGRDIAELDRLRDVIWRAFGWSIAFVALLACLGGWFVTRRVLGRIDAMTETAKGIMAGNLSGRLPIAGTNDELDRLGANLNAMLDRIGELMAGMREVSDNIAHDLKTPLTRLRNGAEEALREAVTVEDYRAVLESTIEEADNLIKVFNALLMIARAEAGSTREGMGAFDAAEVARDVAELYEPLAEEAGVPLRLAVDTALPMHGSRELVGQAIANLVDNALKYASVPRAGAGADAVAADGSQPHEAVRPEIVIEARQDGASVAFSVADRGEGIAPADRGRAMERFVRLDGSRSRPGFGLGLSLAAAIARLHGGTLRLDDNAPGLKAVLSLPQGSAGPPGQP
jgi:signal transduction histidine kinase